MPTARYEPPHHPSHLHHAIAGLISQQINFVAVSSETRMTTPNAARFRFSRFKKKNDGLLHKPSGGRDDTGQTAKRAVKKPAKAAVNKASKAPKGTKRTRVSEPEAGEGIVVQPAKKAMKKKPVVKTEQEGDDAEASLFRSSLVDVGC